MHALFSTNCHPSFWCHACPFISLWLPPGRGSTVDHQHLESCACRSIMFMISSSFLSPPALFFFKYFSLGVLFIHFKIKFYSLLFLHWPAAKYFLFVHLKCFAFCLSHIVTFFSFLALRIVLPSSRFIFLQLSIGKFFIALESPVPASAPSRTIPSLYFTLQLVSSLLKAPAVLIGLYFCTL